MNSKLPFGNNSAIPKFSPSRPTRVHVEETIDINGPVVVTEQKSKMGWLIWLVVLLIVGALIYFFAPEWVTKCKVLCPNEIVVQKPNCNNFGLNNGREIDWGKLIIWSIIITLILFFIYWLFSRGTGNCGANYKKC